MRPLIASLALLVLVAPVAQAQTGARLEWENCEAGRGYQDRSLACDSDTGTPCTAFGTIVLLQDLPDFAAATSKIAVCLTSAPTPWWALLPGQCSENRLRVSFAPEANTSSCADIWMGQPPVEVSAVHVATDGSGWAVLEAVGVLPDGQTRPVPADGSELYLFRLTLLRSRTTGPDARSGCTAPAAISLDEVRLLQPSNPVVTLTGRGPSTLLTCNDADVGYCLGVPARNRSWGLIKSMYR